MKDDRKAIEGEKYRWKMTTVVMIGLTVDGLDGRFIHM